MIIGSTRGRIENSKWSLYKTKDLKRADLLESIQKTAIPKMTRTLMVIKPERKPSESLTLKEKEPKLERPVLKPIPPPSLTREECFLEKTEQIIKTVNEMTRRSESTRRTTAAQDHKSRILSRRTKSATNERIGYKSRTRSLGDVERFQYIRNVFDGGCKLSRSVSLNSMNHDLTAHYYKNSNRFKELIRFYKCIEKVKDLSKAASMSDVNQPKNEQADYDVWKKVRTAEKVMKEMNDTYSTLKTMEKENNLLFECKSVEDVKWKKDTDVGLRRRKYSIRFLKEVFTTMKRQNLERPPRTIMCPYIEHVSVMDAKPKSVSVEYATWDERHGRKDNPNTTISKWLVNSLTKDQVQKLKEQLKEIYGNAHPNNKTIDAPPSTKVVPEKKDLLSQPLPQTLPQPLPPKLIEPFSGEEKEVPQEKEAPPKLRNSKVLREIQESSKNKLIECLEAKVKRMKSFNEDAEKEQKVEKTLIVEKAPKEEGKVKHVSLNLKPIEKRYQTKIRIPLTDKSDIKYKILYFEKKKYDDGLEIRRYRTTSDLNRAGHLSDSEILDRKHDTLPILRRKDKAGKRECDYVSQLTQHEICVTVATCSLLTLKQVIGSLFPESILETPSKTLRAPASSAGTDRAGN